MIANQRKNAHLLWRAAFGPPAEGLNQLDRLSPSDLYAALKAGSAKTPALLTATDDTVKGLFKGIQEEGERRQMERGGANGNPQKRREGLKNLNLLWLEEMVASPAQLREKMAFFWHGHFASRNLNVYFQQLLLDVLRRHALGSFRELLHEVAKTPAMLFFLNAAQNDKTHPNENFAREVMELFTLGRGHYTEADVKEAARAFTGWSANLQGEFVFRKNAHDNGVKNLLGYRGKFGGEEVLDILLAQQQTARFLVQKIYRFFVNETVDESRIDALAQAFYQSDYHIGKLMDAIFLSDWFYEERNIGVRIKSPVELLVGLRRLLPMELENPESQLLLQRLLGQVLLMPPNVAGWPGGKAWIDSTTLLYRLRLPQLLLGAEDWSARAKDDDDLLMTAAPATMANAKTTVDWKAYRKNFDPVPRQALLPTMVTWLLQTSPSFSMEGLRAFADETDRERFVQSATVALLSTPEYQLC